MKTKNGMIKLEGAKILAEIILDNDLSGKVPKVNSLPKWKELGLIMPPEEKRRGWYDKSLPIQLATVVELMDRGATAEEIRKVTERILPKLKDSDQSDITTLQAAEGIFPEPRQSELKEPFYTPRSVWKQILDLPDVDKITQDYKEADRKRLEADSEAERKKYHKQKQKAIERLQFQELATRYLDTWEKYRKRLNLPNDLIEGKYD